MDRQSVPTAAGLLLTGGASRRMGRDKAALRTGGRSWAERVASALAEVTGPCIEVGGHFSGLASVADDLPGGGPLAAVATGYAALIRAGHRGGVVVVATDLPFVGPGALGLLAGWPGEGSVVPVVDGRPQVLCARWSAAALAGCAARVAAGERAMAGLLRRDDVTLLQPAQWSDKVDALEWVDVDTPADALRTGLEVR